MDDLRLTVALEGRLEDWEEGVRLSILRAIKDAAGEEARGFLETLREEVAKAGLGIALGNAWRLELFPAGQKLAWEPTAFIHSNAPQIIEAFTTGQPIHGHPLLAIPIPGSPAAELKLRRGQERVAEITRRWGPLRPVRLASGVLMLIASGRDNNQGGVRPLATVSRNGARFTPLNQARADIPMFWVVPQVRLEKRLNWPALAQQAERGFAGRVEANLRRRLERPDGEPEIN